MQGIVSMLNVPSLGSNTSLIENIYLLDPNFGISQFAMKYDN